MALPRKNSASRLPADVDKCVRLAACQVGLLPSDILGPNRRQDVADARMVAMALVRRWTGMSFPAIGHWFDRDHSTVIHAAQTCDGPGRGDLGARVAYLISHLTEEKRNAEVRR